MRVYAKAKIGGEDPWHCFAGTICIGTDIECNTLTGQQEALGELSDYIDGKMAEMMPKESFREPPRFLSKT